MPPTLEDLETASSWSLIELTSSGFVTPSGWSMSAAARVDAVHSGSTKTHVATTFQKARQASGPFDGEGDVCK